MKCGKYLVISIIVVSAMMGGTWIWCCLTDNVVCDACGPKRVLQVGRFNRKLLENDRNDFSIRYVLLSDVWRDMFGCCERVDDEDLSNAIEIVEIKEELPVLRLDGYVLGAGADLNNAVLFIVDVASGESVYVHVGDWISARYGVECVRLSDCGRFEEQVPLLEVVVYDFLKDERFKIYEN